MKEYRILFNYGDGSWEDEEVDFSSVADALDFINYDKSCNEGILYKIQEREISEWRDV